MISESVIRYGKRLRCGYTTGSCAAAAAKAAALMVHTGKIPAEVTLETPAGIKLSLKVGQPQYSGNEASCCITKDAGDDPDVTNGIKIFATVRKRDDGQVVIDGGEGIGRITRQGFWGEVGDAAINPVPCKMIKEAVEQIATHGWDVLISAPQGRIIAEKTFNARLGIKGGISILGTTGVVSPMSDEALKRAIYLEIDAIHDSGACEVLLFLGNYGERMVEQLHLSAPKVKISNFIGEAVAYCYQQGFQRVTLIGHIGKLSKLAIGAFNTHNYVCDSRIEAFVYYLALAGAPIAFLQKIHEAITSEDALNILLESEYVSVITDMQQGCITRLRKYVKDPSFSLNVIIYSLEHGILT